MRSKTILGLVLLNVLLLASLVFHKSWIPSAGAQVPVRGTAPSEYLMVSGEVQGGTSGVLFIIDTRNNWLTLRAYNGNSTAMEDMLMPVDLARVFK